MLRGLLLALAASICQGTGWQQRDRVQPIDTVTLQIAVKQSPKGIARLERRLLELSDPQSSEYGQWLTLNEVENMVAPLPSTLLAVRSWLEGHGVTPEESLNGDFVSATVPAQLLENMTRVPYYHFQHVDGHSAIRSVRDPVWSGIAHLVDFISPSTRLPTLRGQRTWPVRPVGAGDNEDISPTMLRKLYSVPDQAVGSDRSSQAVASFLEQYYSPADLLSFQKKYDPSSAGRLPDVVGNNDPTEPTLEASLDIQYLMSMAPNMTTEFWYTPGDQPDNKGAEPFIAWLAQVSSTPDAQVPKVFSISYADDECDVDESYARRVSVEFQKAGARGISLLVASGDFGVGGNTNAQCTEFLPTFPASSPFITGVGGTWFQNPEVGAQFSGGGFSNLFERPSYQKEAVATFIQTASSMGKLPNENMWNGTGRAFPDVSAQGANFPLFVNGGVDSAYGTSASTPVMAAIVALLNDERAKSGKPSLGFLNPFLYQNPTAFTDITDGNNPACGSRGFYACQDWDAVTGLGTPNFEKLAAVVAALP